MEFLSGVANSVSISAASDYLDEQRAQRVLRARGAASEGEEAGVRDTWPMAADEARCRRASGEVMTLSRPAGLPQPLEAPASSNGT